MSDLPPPLRPFSRGPVPVQSADEAAALDRRAIDAVGVPEPVLMENAGRSAALVSRAVFFGDGARSPDGRPGRREPSVVALVGSGNNGGDALVALRSFAAWGHAVRAVLVADRDEDDPLRHGWGVDMVRDDALDDDALSRILGASELVLDGILGTGVKGAPRERQARVIRVLNQIGGGRRGRGRRGAIHGARPAEWPMVVALDVPSGVDASTGAVPGEAVEADLTVSFGAPKLGALLPPARARVGRHVTVEIGFPPMVDDDASSFLVTPAWAMESVPRRSTDTHKNRVGRVVIVGGGAGMAGAAILAGQAAFRSGAGLVQIASVAENRESIHGALPEAIFVDVADSQALEAALGQADAVAAGPGLGTREVAAQVLRSVVDGPATPLVLDADALNLAAEGAIDLADVSKRRPVLITPHPGEMSRLVGRDTAARPDTDASSADVARSAAARFGCAVLYKGAPSLVATPAGALAVDSQSSSDLAVAGMGDTLTGVCVGLLGQRAGTDSTTDGDRSTAAERTTAVNRTTGDRMSDPARVGALALYLTGRAATLAERGPGLTPSDVAERLPDALGELLEGARSPTDVELPFVILDADAAR